MSQINIHPEMHRDRPLDSTPAHGWLKALSNMMADDQLPLPHLHPRILLPSQAKAPGVVPQPPSLSSPSPPGPAFPLAACSCPSPGAHNIGPASVSYCWPLQHIYLHPLGSCILPPPTLGVNTGWTGGSIFLGTITCPLLPFIPLPPSHFPRPGGKFHLFPPAGDTPCDTSWRVGEDLKRAAVKCSCR